MKAAVHLAIFVITVFDYFYPKKTSADDSDLTTHDIEDNYKLMDVDHRRFNSVQERSLYPFDDEEEEEEHKETDDDYQRIEDTVEGYATHDGEQPGLIKRVWNGASTIMNKYHKRKHALERHTAKVTREAVSDFIEKRREQSAQVAAEREINTYLYSTE